MPGLRLLPTLSVLLALAVFYYWYTTTVRVDEVDTTPAPLPEISLRESVPEPTLPGGESGEFGLPAASPIEAEITATPGTGSSRLSGWIRNLAGAGLKDIRIELHSQELEGEEAEVHRGTSDSLGEFRFDNLIAGRAYRLEIQATTEYAAYRIDSIRVDENGASREIVLEPIRLVDVDGMIVDANLAPIPDFTFRLRSLVVDFPERVITSDSSGFFHLEGFPEGELRIATSNRDYYRIKGLELKADEYQTLTLVVDRGNYHLSGWVTDEFGLPLEEARITVKSAFAAGGYHSFSYRSTLTDSNGGFAFPDLGGKRYTLGVYANGYESHIRNHEFQSFADTLEIRLTRQAE